MNRFILFIGLLFAQFIILGQQQTPAILWSNTFGGSSDEEIYKIIKDKTGGYLAVGYTYSNNYDITNSHGSRDLWVIRFNENGDTLWTKTYGGSYDDYGQAVVNTSDSCFVIAGYSYSDNGDISENNGSSDFWILKIDTNGQIIWSKNYGGSDMDEAHAIIELPNSDLFVVGFTMSEDSDVYNVHGADEVWVLKLAPNGDTVWTQSYGGAGYDRATAITQLPGGTYAIAGYSSSVDGDLIVNNGGYDFWVFTIDTGGILINSFSYGGSVDEVAYDIASTPDTGFIVVGYSSSNDSDVSNNYGYKDMWVVRGKSNGDIDWSRNIGGSDYDIARAVEFTPNKECIIAGYTKSNDYDVHKPHGNYDAYVVCLDEYGAMLWNQVYGGEDYDLIFSMLAINDYYYFAGYSQSINGDIYQPNKGGQDVWLAKLTNPLKTYDSLACKNTSTTLFVDAGGLEMTELQWYYKNNPIPDSTAATFTIDSVNEHTIGTYYCTINDQEQGTVDTAFFRVNYYHIYANAVTVDPTLYQFDGSIEIYPDGDNPPFTVLWPDGAFGYANNKIGLVENKITIIDSMDCEFDTIIKVNAKLFEFGMDTFMVNQNTLYANNIAWGGEDTLIGAYDSLNGSANTAAIVETLGEGKYAAYVCDTLREGGITDWFLPALEQLKIMQNNRLQIGSFNSYTYWSSTEIDSANAFGIFFNTGGIQTIGKHNDAYNNARCIAKYHIPKPPCHIAYYPLDSVFYLDNTLSEDYYGIYYGNFETTDDRTGELSGAYHIYDNNYATIPHVASPEKSISVWFKLEDNSTDEPLLVKRVAEDTTLFEMELIVNSSGAVVYSYYDFDQNLFSIKTDDNYVQLHEWHHAVVTSKPLNDTILATQLYVDNLLIGSDTVLYPIVDVGDYQLGYFSADSIYDIRLDDINYYTCVVDQHVVDSLYHDKEGENDDCQVHALALDSNMAKDLYTGQSFPVYNTLADTNRFFYPQKAMLFNGINAYIDLDPGTSGPVFACWIKTSHYYSDTMTVYSVTDTINNVKSSWDIINGTLHYQITNSKTIEDTTFLADGKFHHIAIEWIPWQDETDSIFIYIDNEIRTKDTIHLSQLQVTHGRIGALYSNGTETQFYKGIIDDFNIKECPSFTAMDIDSMYYANNWPEDTMSVSLNIYPAPCYDSAGMVEITTFKATKPYTYYWSDGDTTYNVYDQTINRYLVAGNYTITITDSLGAVKIKSFYVSQPDSFDIYISAYDPKCHGENSGNLYVAVSGGTPNYHYQWNTGDTTNFLDTLPAGNYTITITDSNKCVTVRNVNLNEPPLLTVSVSAEQPLCYGQKNGVLIARPEGGTPNSGQPYTYQWVGPGVNSIDSIIDTALAGTYYLTVYDENYCAAYDTIVLGQPDSILITVDSIVHSTGSDGAIYVSVSGGVGNYVYDWDYDDINDYDDPEDITGLEPNTYTLAVKDSNGCINLAEATVDSVAKDLTLAYSQENVDCYGTLTGKATVWITSGTPPYSYRWSTGDSLINTYDTVYNLENLAAGEYSVTVTDSNDISKHHLFVITQPDSLFIVIDSVISTTGENGAIYISVEGGVGNYTYDWDNDSLNDYDDSEDLTGLSAGTYSVTVQDSNFCSAFASATVDSITVLTVHYLQKDVTCYNASNGEATAIITAGTPPYNYCWSTGDSLINTYDTAFTLTNLKAGDYTVTVSDSTGDSTIYTFIITEPNPILITAGTVNLTCYGDTNAAIYLDVSGGSGHTYSYDWNTGDTTESLTNIPAGRYSVTVTDSLLCETYYTVDITQPAKLTAQASVVNNASSGSACDGLATVVAAGGSGSYQYIWNDNDSQNTDTAYNLCAGTYMVTVTDSNNCSTTDSVTILIEASPLVVSTSATDPNCHGNCDGYAVVTISGGEAPYTILWDDPAHQTTDTASGLCAGTYTVSVTDHNGLSTVDTVTLIDPEDLELTILTINATCGHNDGIAQVTVENGSGDYSYEWSNGDVTNRADSLPAGTGHILVTDQANGCSTARYFTIENTDAPSLELSGKNIACNGESTGEITLTITGTAYPYQVMWSNGISTTLSGTTASQMINNLPAGTYEVDVIDTNGCLAHDMIVLTENTPFDLTFTSTNASCGHNDGAVSLNVTGGTAPYSIQWNTGDTLAMLNNLLAGNYSVTVNDSNDCSVSGSIAVIDSGAPVLSIDTIVAARCNQTGAIFISAEGVDASTYYVWDSTIIGKDLTDAEPGTHTLVVDNHGCKAVLNATIPYIPPQPQPICVVTVDSVTAANLIVWQKQDTATIDHYNVYREGSRPGEYFLLGSRSIDSLTYFVDSSAYSWIRSYRYKISTVDKCGNESELSPLHKTVHLTVNLAYTTTDETKVNLLWDDYEGFDYETFYVSQYSLHNGWEVLDSLPRDLHSYTAVVPEGGAIYVVTVKLPGEACWASRMYSGPYVQSYSNVDDLRANGGSQQDTTSDSTAISLQNSAFNDIELYPNPNNGSFTVTGKHIVAVNIYNANGQLIEQRHTAAVNTLFVKPKAKLTEGIYFVKIVTQNAIVVKKIMVE